MIGKQRKIFYSTYVATSPAASWVVKVVPSQLTLKVWLVSILFSTRITTLLSGVKKATLGRSSGLPE